jgi:hypothetical protein
MAVMARAMPQADAFLLEAPVTVTTRAFVACHHQPLRRPWSAFAPALSLLSCNDAVPKARNQEKAQSMLYRFREAQAAEFGLSTRADKRPRMASACQSLRECERWRGELLREISRKVAKIQDAGLTEYEVRDLNDGINGLMREKRHWENQIVALGGANYRRNVAMLDDDGKEVPGTKGYKCASPPPSLLPAALLTPPQVLWPRKGAPRRQGAL